MLLYEKEHSHHDAQCQVEEPVLGGAGLELQDGDHHQGTQMHNEGWLSRQLPATDKARRH